MFAYKKLIKNTNIKNWLLIRLQELNSGDTTGRSVYSCDGFVGEEVSGILVCAIGEDIAGTLQIAARQSTSRRGVNFRDPTLSQHIAAILVRPTRVHIRTPLLGRRVRLPSDYVPI